METYTNRGSGVSHQRERLYINFFIEHLVHKLLTIVTRFPVLLKISVLKNYIMFIPKITNKLRLLRTINLKEISHLVLSGWFRIQAICLIGSFFEMIKTRGAFRTQLITLTMYLLFLVNYFLKKVLS